MQKSYGPLIRTPNPQRLDSQSETLKKKIGDKMYHKSQKYRQVKAQTNIAVS